MKSAPYIDNIDDDDDDKDQDYEEDEDDVEGDDVEDVQLLIGRGARRAARDKERDCCSYHPKGKH